MWLTMNKKIWQENQINFHVCHLTFRGEADCLPTLPTMQLTTMTGGEMREAVLNPASMEPIS